MFTVWELKPVRLTIHKTPRKLAFFFFKMHELILSWVRDMLPYVVNNRYTTDKVRYMSRVLEFRVYADYGEFLLVLEGGINVHLRR